MLLKFVGKSTFLERREGGWRWYASLTLDLPAPPIGRVFVILIFNVGHFLFPKLCFPARALRAQARRACALRALGLLLADGAPIVGRGKTS